MHFIVLYIISDTQAYSENQHYTLSGDMVKWKARRKGHPLPALPSATQLSENWHGFPASTRLWTCQWMYSLHKNTAWDFLFFFFLLTIVCETSELLLPFIIIFGHYLNILINVRNRSCDSALAVARKKCSAAELQSGLKCLFMYLHEERRPDRFFLSIWLPVSLLIWTEAFCIWLPLACFISLLHCPVL